MPALAEKQHEEISRQEPLGDRVNQQNGLTEIRSKVHALLDHFEENKLATRQTIAEYRKGADQDKSTEGLKGYYQWIAQEWFKAGTKLNKLQRDLDEGIRTGIMSKNDREFLMKKLVLSDEEDFVGNVDKIEELLKGKIDRMRADRKQYDELAVHPLVKNTGFIKTDAGTKIDFPDEKAFLKLTVPERREVLKKVKDALPRAERHAETRDSAESGKMTAEYAKQLESARKEGIIGRKSIEKYLDGFKKIDRAEKEAWLKEMKNGKQLRRYRQLWKDIHSTLKGSALSQMESLRDQMGYTELLNKCGQLKDIEAQRINREYGQKLETAFQNRVISLHTKRAFMADMQAQPLEKKQFYMEQFENQMQRYRDLRSKINILKNKDARASLNEMYLSGEWGYTEIEAKYNRLAGRVASRQAAAPLTARAQKHLASIRNDSIKGAATYANQMMDDGQKRSLVEKLTAFFQGRDSQSQDASSYQANMKTARKEHQAYYQQQPNASRRPETEQVNDAEPVTEFVSGDVKQQLADEDSNRVTKSKNTKAAHPAAKKQANAKPVISAPATRTRIDATKAYQRTSFRTREGEKNVTRLGIGEKGALEAFISDKPLSKLRDRLKLIAKDGSAKYELTQQDSQGFINYLRSEIDNPDEE